MRFPTSDEIQAFNQWLKLTELERQIHLIDPSITFESGGHVSALMAPAPPGKVAAGIVRFPSWLGWCVMAPGGVPPIPWPLDADTADVARCFVGRIEEHRGGVMPSPWRWGEGARTVAVELADRLVDLDFDVVFVADANRTVPRRSDVQQLPAALGPVVRFNAESFAAMYSERPLVGWTLDVEWNGRALRVPLEPPAGDGTPASEPATATARWLADTAARALVQDAGEIEKRAFDLAMLDDGPGPAEAVAWLRRCGLPAELSHLGGGKTGVEVPDRSVILHRSSRAVGTAAVQAGYGVAAVEGKKPMLFSSSGYTRDAVRWAERAGIALWTMRGPGRSMVAETTLSKGLKPVVVDSYCGKSDVENL